VPGAGYDYCVVASQAGCPDFSASVAALRDLVAAAGGVPVIAALDLDPEQTTEVHL
jgi:hypothetical protein